MRYIVTFLNGETEDIGVADGTEMDIDNGCFTFLTPQEGSQASHLKMWIPIHNVKNVEAAGYD